MNLLSDACTCVYKGLRAEEAWNGSDGLDRKGSDSVYMAIVLLLLLSGHSSQENSSECFHITLILQVPILHEIDELEQSKA